MNQEEHTMLIIIKFKTAMLKSSLCYYSGASIFIKGKITFT